LLADRSGIPGGGAELQEKGRAMIVVVEQHNAQRHANLLDEMFRMRARVFGDRLKWDVNIANGMERDKFDDEAPVYLIYVDDNTGAVVGSLRLLPTTGPTLLAAFFSDTVPAAADISAPTIWECTRFCLDANYFGKGARDELLFASSVLIIALGEIAIKAGIQSILGNFDSTILRLYRQLGCEVEVLGATQRYGRAVYLGSFPVSEEIVHRLKARQKVSILSRSRETRTLAA
jgi:acyl homoserine lactone synthase